MSAAGAGIPRLGQNSSEHQKLHLRAGKKLRLNWGRSTLTLPCTQQGLAAPLWRHHCP